MAEYKDGVSIETIQFNGIDEIGVASDGIRFIADLDSDISLKEPQTYETISAMAGVIKKVAQYKWVTHMAMTTDAAIDNKDTSFNPLKLCSMS